MQLRPVRMSVQLGSGGRYGVQYDQTAVDALFDATASLLGDALGSAQRPVQVTEGAWREGPLRRMGHLLRLPGHRAPDRALRIPVPALSIRPCLRRTSGGSCWPRREGTVRLYYSNESTGLYYACDTAEALRGHVQTRRRGLQPPTAPCSPMRPATPSWPPM